MGHKVGWRHYVDGQFEIRREYVNVQFNSLRQKIADNQRDIELFDGKYNAIIEHAKEGLRLAIGAAEARINDKFTATGKALEKADEVLQERLRRNDAFREKLQADAALMVTRDQLELTLKSISTELDLLKRAVTLRTGETGGMTKVGSAVVMAFTGIAGVAATISAAITIMSKAGAP